MGFISVSVPASRGGAELRWERNLPSTGGNPSDRQIAYENLQRFLKMTERIYPKFTAGEKVAWDNLKLSMQSYEEHEDTLPLPR
ncbi:hypothetical protein N9195_01070 [bacterium]|nr:hypothetical protein [bacterium]